MPRIWNTLRFRLTLAYVAIFGLLQGGLWAGVDVARGVYLRRSLDADLADRAAHVAATLRETPAEQWSAALLNLAGPDLSLLVRDATGQVRAHAGPLPAAAFPPDAADASPVFSTAASSAQPPAAPQRIVTIAAPIAAVPDVRVQAAASLAPVQTLIREMRRLLAIFVPASLLIATVTAWFIARRALRPIDRVVRQARGLSVARLNQRLPALATKDEVAELVAVINEMLARLESELKGQQRFIADVSHELKTPLAVLLGESQALKRSTAADATALAFAQTVEEETRRLVRTVDAFQIVTRAQAGARPPLVADVPIEDVVLHAVQKCTPTARAKDVKLLPQFTEVEGSNTNVAGDSGLLNVMLECLVQNAIGHAPPGTIVTVAVQPRLDSVAIAVADRGPGIPPDLLDRVFDSFRQAECRNQQDPRAGLGLAITKGVVLMHRGAFAARNLDGGGTEFAVTLPRQAAARSARPATTAPRAADALAS
jgi:two-component system, OmpR family, sensor kinase